MAAKRATRAESATTKAKPVEIKVEPAKGRPMLQWAGKRPLSRVPAYPAQHIETFDPVGALAQSSDNPSLWKDWPVDYPHGGLLFHGDNKEVLAHLLANGYRSKVDLIYIDPPFNSGADYVRKVNLRGVVGAQSMEVEGDSLGQQQLYADIWSNDAYLQFMYERLLLLRELLSPEGAIWVHVDWHYGHYLKAILDEVFGRDAMVNEVIWYYWNKFQMRGMSGFARNHETLFWYARSPKKHFFEPQAQALDRPKKLKRIKWDAEKGRIQNVKDEEGRVIYDEFNDEKVDDVWDLPYLGTTAGERVGFSTQKPEELLERVIRSSVPAGGIVLDAFVGSGTTAVAAQRLGRRWIACDINQGAIQTASRRLQALVREQAESHRLVADDEVPGPAQLAFTVWRVNDYDLQIQHNEAVNLACDFIGVERLRSDGFFDGTLGKSLVKVAPFNHPLTQLDLEEVKRELDARPDEDRAITLVSLGIEIGARGWIEDWNRLRRGKNAINRIEVIELRTDPRYGGVIRHEPAQAKVKVRRAKGRLHVEIEDFVSPTIIQRLEQQGGLLKPQIDDWRAMVDSVSIDPAYDGEVLNIAIADVPERKADLVSGKYDLEAPKGETTVAVKIIDMLGEEVLVIERV